MNLPIDTGICEQGRDVLQLAAGEVHPNQEEWKFLRASKRVRLRCCYFIFFKCISVLSSFVHPLSQFVTSEWLLKMPIPTLLLHCISLYK